MTLEPLEITQELIDLYAPYSDRTEGVGLIEDCSKSIIVFSKHMLGISLYTWQRIIALDIMKAIEANDGDKVSREFVVLTSRQIGKSKLASIIALWIAAFNKTPSGDGNNSDVGIISAGGRQAKLMLKEVKNNILLGDAYCRKTYSREKGDLMDRGFLSNLFDDKEDNNSTTKTLKAQEFIKDENGVMVTKLHESLLKGSLLGTSLNSYPPTAGVLGQTFAYLHEDEAGKTDKFTDEAHNDYLHPTGDARDAIRLYTSTAWTTSGFFYILCDPDDTQDEHDYKRYAFDVDSIKIENPKQWNVVQKEIKKMRIQGNKDAVNRAYYCRFVKGESTYFAPEDVDNVFGDNNLTKVDTYPGLCDIGVDFGGQVKSKTVITVTRMTEDGHIERLYDKVYPVGEDNSIIADLEEIMKHFPGWERIIPDECPQGDYLIREMVDKGWNVHPMSFRTWKVKKFGAMRSRMKRGLVKSYKDEELKIEMKALEFSNTSKQSNIQAPHGYNDDRTDSFLMSMFFYLGEEESAFKGWDLDEDTGSECKWL